MAEKLKELHELRCKSIADARKLVDAADKGKRDMTTDEETQYDAFMGDAKRFMTDIGRVTELETEERRTAEMAAAHAGESAGGEKRDIAPEVELRTRAFRNLLMAGPEAMSPEEARSLVTGSDTQAGFLNAPQEFVQQLIKRVDDEVFLEKKSTGFTTTNANGLGFPTLETDPNDFEMISEIKAAPEDTSIAFGKREFKPHLAKKLIKISDKMLRSDGMDAEAIVLARATYKLGITKENKYLLGTGNQEPLGLFVASAKGIPTSRDISADMTATDFTPDALKNAKYSLKAQYMKLAEWLFHRDAVAKIAKLKDGEGRYMFETSNTPGAVDSLLGRPINMSEYVPNTFTASQYVGLFGDLSKYWTVNSLALRIKRLNELYAVTSEVGFVFEVEFDGMPVLDEAFSRLKTAAS